MAPHALENEDHSRDAAFNKTLHGKSAKARGGLTAIMSGKGADSQKAAVDEYFKHWDNKDAKDETPETREVRNTRQLTKSWPVLIEKYRREERSTQP